MPPTACPRMARHIFLLTYHESTYPSVAASEAYAHRVFSVCGYLSTGRSNRLSKNMEHRDPNIQLTPFRCNVRKIESIHKITLITVFGRFKTALSPHCVQRAGIFMSLTYMTICYTLLPTKKTLSDILVRTCTQRLIIFAKQSFH